MKNNQKMIVGLDEVGVGPLAGPVVAAAVILPARFNIPDLKDSKLLTAIQREKLYKRITETAIDWAIGRAEVEEIDKINILQAGLLAMQRAYQQLKVKAELAMVDGRFAPTIDIDTQTIIDGDKLIPAISAASILAKVTRDQEMMAMEELYPGYAFAKHKGYSTKLHLENLRRLGPSPIHRKSFQPVSELID